MNYYGVTDLGNNLFSPYFFFKKTPFISINGYLSDLPFIRCFVRQDSILGPFLFHIYINDLYYAIKYCKVHRFEDDTNLLNLSDLFKKINKLVNYDLKVLNNAVMWWLSLLHNFIHQNLNSSSAQIQVLLAACWRYVMMRIPY